MKKNRWTDKDEIQKRANKHGCDGRCYWETKYDEKTGAVIEKGGMCGGAETCEETRRGEFWATVVAIIIVTPIVFLMWACDWACDKITHRKDKNNG